MKKYMLMQRILIPTLILGGATIVTVPTLTSCGSSKITQILLDNNTIPMVDVYKHEVATPPAPINVINWNDDWAVLILSDNDGLSKTSDFYYALAGRGRSEGSSTSPIKIGAIATNVAEFKRSSWMIDNNFYFDGRFDQYDQPICTAGNYNLTGFALTKMQYENLSIDTSIYQVVQEQAQEYGSTYAKKLAKEYGNRKIHGEKIKMNITINGSWTPGS